MAKDLLVRLGIMTLRGELSDTGHKASRLPLHPRLARLLLAAVAFGVRREGIELAARLSEARFRLDETRRGRFASDVDAVLAMEASYPVRRLQTQLLHSVGETKKAADSHALEKALLLAFPDRVARRRGETILFSNGAPAALGRGSSCARRYGSRRPPGRGSRISILTFLASHANQRGRREAMSLANPRIHDAGEISNSVIRAGGVVECRRAQTAPSRSRLRSEPARVSKRCLDMSAYL